MTETDDPIGRIMDKAAGADRRALFAALQAATLEVVDLQHGGGRGDPWARIEEALDRGTPLGAQA